MCDLSSFFVFSARGSTGRKRGRPRGSGRRAGVTKPKPKAKRRVLVRRKRESAGGRNQA